MIIFVIGSLLIATAIFLIIAIPVLFILAPTLFFLLLAIFALSTMGMVGQGLAVALLFTIIAFVIMVIVKQKTGIDLFVKDWK